MSVKATYSVDSPQTSKMKLIGKKNQLPCTPLLHFLTFHGAVSSSSTLFESLLSSVTLFQEGISACWICCSTWSKTYNLLIYLSLFI